MTVKTVLLTLGVALLAIQLLPIDQQLPYTDPALELHVVQPPPDAVMAVLKNACYDCHSNHTRWPWYAALQPVGWWLQGHVQDGRAELNFSEFGRWNAEERREVLDHCAALIEKKRMPLRNYLPLHPEARLSPAQQQLLVDWLRNANTGTAIPARDSCDDPDADPRCCFVLMPAEPGMVMTIAPEDEPGERLVIRGQIVQKDGRTPAANTLLYAYHTDISGKYIPNSGSRGVQRRHGRLHGWCRTDAAGRYEIHTIRPAHYPGQQFAAHIHPVVWPAGAAQPFFINDFVFADDSLVDARYRAAERRNGGSSGIMTVRKNAAGVWEGERDIILP